MFKFISKAYSSLNGPILALIGIAVSGIPIYFNMNSTISLKVFFPLAIVVFACASVLVRALHFASNQISLPRIRKGLPATKPYDEFSFLALLDPYRLFTFNTVLSVFIISDGVEILVGTGRVINIQQNEKLLVGVRMVDGRESISDEIVHNNQQTLESIVIKPMVEAEA